MIGTASWERNSSTASADATAGGDLRVEGVSKSFDDVEVLRDVRFAVAGGEFVTLLGPSGCGKTTLIRILAGLEMADAGDVILGGRRVTDLPARHRPINTVFQNYALFPHLRVADNIAFGLRSRRFPGAEIEQRVRQAAQMLQLEPLAGRYPHQLSGGQKQRVALARALVNEPELLLLDEPMSALDAKLRAEVQIELRRLQRRLGKTFLLVTHDQDEAMTVSDRILVMRDGRIEQAGTPSDVYERPVNRFVAEFLGSANLIEGTRFDACVQTAYGVLVPAERPAWDVGTLAIRPERIRLGRRPAGVNAVRGAVRDVGDHVDLFIEPGPLRVRTGPAEDLRAGAEVWLELPAEYLVPLAG